MAPWDTHGGWKSDKHKQTLSQHSEQVNKVLKKNVQLLRNESWSENCNMIDYCWTGFHEVQNIDSGPWGITNKIAGDVTGEEYAHDTQRRIPAWKLHVYYGISIHDSDFLSLAQLLEICGGFY